MSGAIPPLPQYAFMAWCSVKSIGTTLPLPSLDYTMKFATFLKSWPADSQILGALCQKMVTYRYFTDTGICACLHLMEIFLFPEISGIKRGHI
jgi:hypothetical protein